MRKKLHNWWVWEVDLGLYWDFRTLSDFEIPVKSSVSYLNYYIKSATQSNVPLLFYYWNVYTYPNIAKTATKFSFWNVLWFIVNPAWSGM
jgi:hypothetical protein